MGAQEGRGHCGSRSSPALAVTLSPWGGLRGPLLSWAGWQLCQQWPAAAWAGGSQPAPTPGSTQKSPGGSQAGLTACAASRVATLVVVGSRASGQGAEKWFHPLRDRLSCPCVGSCGEGRCTEKSRNLPRAPAVSRQGFDPVWQVPAAQLCFCALLLWTEGARRLREPEEALSPAFPGAASRGTETQGQAGQAGSGRDRALAGRPPSQALAVRSTGQQWRQEPVVGPATGPAVRSCSRSPGRAHVSSGQHGGWDMPPRPCPCTADLLRHHPAHHRGGSLVTAVHSAPHTLSCTQWWAGQGQPGMSSPKTPSRADPVSLGLLGGGVGSTLCGHRSCGHRAGLGGCPWGGVVLGCVCSAEPPPPPLPE